ncbi:MAG: SDR family oxidoreductase [Acidobacteriota bacterium]|nr:SDR family oxidoreductase [Acidobacteriota bacterium]
MSLEGKVVLVTGAAKRIGRSIAIALAAEGVRVAIHYNGSEREARETAQECGGAPVFQANLESVAEIRGMFDKVLRHFSRLDGLVNNAARFTNFDPLEIEESDWDFIHSVNLKSVFFCCQSAAKIMLAGEGGHIVNISSLGALKPWAHHAHYCASKAGVAMLTRALAKAWAPKISVNSVAPGVIPFDKVDPRIEKLIALTPAKRQGHGEEVAEAVLSFLKSSRFVTGQLVAVDGGLSQV